MTTAKLFFLSLFFRCCFVSLRRAGGDSRVGEECEFGEGSPDTLLQFLGPPEASCNRWHVLTHWSPACKSRQSLLTHVSHSLVSYSRSSISLLTERGWPHIHSGILIIALISTVFFFLVPVIHGNKNVNFI